MLLLAHATNVHSEAEEPRAAAFADAECDRLAHEMLRLLGGRTLDPTVMPQLDAYIDGPRRPLTLLEQALVQQFPRHRLGLRNEEEVPPPGRPADATRPPTAWRP